MAEEISKISIYVPGSEYDAVSAALSCTEQVSGILQTIAERTRLACTTDVSSGQCRIEANTAIDNDNPNIVNIAISCPKMGEKCPDTCDGLRRFLTSDYVGSLTLHQEFSFI